MQKVITYPILVQDMISRDVINDVVDPLFGGLLGLGIITGAFTGVLKYLGKTSEEFLDIKIEKLDKVLTELGYEKETKLSFKLSKKYLERLKKKLRSASCDKSLDITENRALDCMIEVLEKEGVIKPTIKTKVKVAILKLRKRLEKLRKRVSRKDVVAFLLLTAGIVGIIALGYRYNLFPHEKPWSWSFFKTLLQKIQSLPTKQKVIFSVLAISGLIGFAYLGYKAARIALQKIIKLIKQLVAKVKAKMGRA